MSLTIQRRIRYKVHRFPLWVPFKRFDKGSSVDLIGSGRFPRRYAFVEGLVG